MNSTKIDWCDSTWNPITGCYHNCEYCYARKIANRFKGCDAGSTYRPGETDWKRADNNRGLMAGQGTAKTPMLFDLSKPLLQPCRLNKAKTEKHGRQIYDYPKAPYPFGFAPTFHRYKLGEPKNKTKPQTIFVCSMADLFGEWVPDEWIEAVFTACKEAPQHRYLFLTKNPQRYCKLANAGKLPELDNFWYGSTITKAGACMFAGCVHWNTFLSIEPLLEPLDVGIGSFGCARWIIVGAETGNRAGKVKPERAWIENIIDAARITGAAILLKDSEEMREVWGDAIIQEFPASLQHTETIIPHCKECSHSERYPLNSEI